MKEVFSTDRHDKMIFMGNCEGDPWKEIMFPYLKSKDYEVFYTRCWQDEDGVNWVDFGSWSWFFCWKEK